MTVRNEPDVTIKVANKGILHFCYTFRLHYVVEVHDIESFTILWQYKIFYQIQIRYAKEIDQGMICKQLSLVLSGLGLYLCCLD